MTKVKVKTQFNRMVAILMSVMMLVSCFSVFITTKADAASSSVSVSFENTGMTWKKTFNTSYGAMVAGEDTGFITAGGKPAYCIEPGETLGSGSVLTSGSSAWDSFSSYVRQSVSLAMYYGYPNTNTSLVGDKYDKYVATQLIIWELISGYRDTSTYSRTNTAYYNNLNKTSNTITNYNAIVTAMQNHKKIPSFSGKSTGTAKSVVLKWNSSTNKYTATVTDSNGVLSANGYTFTSTNSNVSFSKSGNKLTISSSVPLTSALTVKGQSKTINEGKSALVWSKNNLQDVITGAGKVDPVPCYIKLTTDSIGSLKITKEFYLDGSKQSMSDISDYSSVKFTVQDSSGNYVYAYSSNGKYIFTGTSTTVQKYAINKNGELVITNLPVGKYTIKESSTNKGYTLNTSTKTATISANKQTSITYKNNANEIHITKEWVIDSSSPSYTNLKQSAQFKLYDSDDSVKYFVCIDSAEGKYKYIPGNQATSLATDTLSLGTSSKSITLYGIPSGTYTLKETGNNAVIRSFNTDDETFTVTEKTSSIQKTITNEEIDDGTIYIFKDIEGDVSTETKNNTVLACTFVIRNYSGNYVKVVQTGVNTYKYYGKGASASDATVKFTSVSSNGGKITITGLPYGNYTVVETSNIDGFVCKSGSQSVTISYSSKTATATIVNQYTGSQPLTISKKFLDANGNSIDLTTNRLYCSKVFFGINDTNNNNIPVWCTNELSGQYEYYTGSYNVDDTTNIIRTYDYTAKEYKSGYVTISKYTVNGNIKTAANTKIDIYNTDSSIAVSATTDSNGKATVSLSNGTYYYVIDGTKYYFDVTEDSVKKPTYENIHLGYTTKNTYVNGLPAGNYVISESVEKSLGDVCIVASDNTVTIKETASESDPGKTVIFNNQLKSSSLKIEKDSWDGLNISREFTITRKLGETVDSDWSMVVYTKSNGSVTVNDLPIYGYDETNDIILAYTYIVTETNASSRYEAHYTITSQEIILVENSVKTLKFVNKSTTSNLEITKLGETQTNVSGAALAGVKFSITSDLPAELSAKAEQYGFTALSNEPYITDSNSKIIIEGLPIAYASYNTETGKWEHKTITYTIKELATNGVNDSFVLADTITTKLVYPTANDDNTYTVNTKKITVYNELKYGYVYLQKADSETGEKLSGAEFTLYNDVNGDGKYTAGTDTTATVYDDDGNAVSKLTEKADDGTGTGFYSISNVPYGKYILRETKTPEGYVEESKDFAFAITEDDQTVHIYETETGYVIGDGSEDELDYVVYNTPITGTGSVIKVDSETGERLSGAKFRIWKDSNGDGKLSSSEDETLGLMTEELDADGNGTGRYFMSNLTYGDYFVSERIAPEGYIRSTKIYSFSIRINGEVVEVGEVANTKIKGSVNVIKLDSETGEKLSGAEFTVYNDVDKDGAYIESVDTVYGVMNEKLDSDGNGTGEYDLTDIPYGSYIVIETKAPEGFIINDKIYPLQIIEQGDNISLTDDGKSGILNKPMKGNIQVLKVDKDTEKPLAGAEFTLYSGDTAVQTLTTGEDGKVTFEALRYGIYFVRETKAPEGYELDSTPLQFFILENGTTLTYTHKDSPEKGNLELIKVSEDDVVEGVQLHIYGTSVNGTTVDETVTTNAEGKATIKNLLIGIYTVEEVGVADYYVPQPTQTIRIEADKTTSIEFHNSLKTGELKVIKTSEDNFVEGVTFRLYGTSESGIVIDVTATTNSSGVALFDNIPISYNLTLTELDVAERYNVPENQQVDIEWNKVTDKTVENTLIKGTVTVTKVDTEYPDNKLSGAEFTVYADNDERTVIGTLTEVQSGVYELENLVYGEIIFLKKQKLLKALNLMKMNIHSALQLTDR